MKKIQKVERLQGNKILMPLMKNQAKRENLNKEKMVLKEKVKMVKVRLIKTLMIILRNHKMMQLKAIE